MRFLTLPTLTIFAGGLLLAAGSESVTYVDGNIADFTPNTAATLDVNNSASMELRTPLHSVQVPYSNISEAKLGEVKSHTPAPEAAYKFWALPKRLMKSESQQIVVSFTSASGQDQTITLELSKPAASSVLAAIERHNAKVANWWGDTYWKTTRNKDSWGGAGTVAQK
jgi:hypothetical protein